MRLPLPGLPPASQKDETSAPNFDIPLYFGKVLVFKVFDLGFVAFVFLVVFTTFAAMISISDDLVYIFVLFSFQSVGRERRVF